MKETKQCNKCNEVKPLDMFHNRTYSPDGKRNQCKRCRSEEAWKRIYGLEAGEYDTLLESQKGVCAICGTDTPSPTQEDTHKHLFVDHCHTSGAVRGLLCSSCNTGLGLFKDNPERLKAAIKYLTK